MMLKGAANTQTEKMALIQPTMATRSDASWVANNVVATINPNDNMLNNTSKLIVDIYKFRNYIEKLFHVIYKKMYNKYINTHQRVFGGVDEKDDKVRSFNHTTDRVDGDDHHTMFSLEIAVVKKQHATE